MSKNSKRLYTWYNYKTKQYESMQDKPPVNRLNEFIPQIPASISLLDLYINDMNKEPYEAWKLVLEDCVPIELRKITK